MTWPDFVRKDRAGHQFGGNVGRLMKRVELAEAGGSDEAVAMTQARSGGSLRGF